MTDTTQVITSAPDLPPPPSVRDLAETRRASLLADKAWGAAYINGDAEKQAQMRALTTILTARGATDDQLADLAKAAGIVRPPADLPAPPPLSPLVSPSASPSDYRPTWSEHARGLPIEELAVVQKEGSEWAAAMQFAKPLGEAILERISEIGPKTAFKMSEAERAEWAREQYNILVRKAGSPENADKMREDARKAAIAIAGNHPWSKVVAESFALNDWWLTATLANHWRAHPKSQK